MRPEIPIPRPIAVDPAIDRTAVRRPVGPPTHLVQRDSGGIISVRGVEPPVIRVLVNDARWTDRPGAVPNLNALVDARIDALANRGVTGPDSDGRAKRDVVDGLGAESGRRDKAEANSEKKRRERFHWTVTVAFSRSRKRKASTPGHAVPRLMVMSRPPRISGVLAAPEFAGALNAFGVLLNDTNACSVG